MDILVVDDDRDVLDVLKMFLESSGHSVAVAAKAKPALEMLEQKQPKLIFLDLRLPDQNGLDVLKTIKSKYPGIVVVMMTGFREADQVVEAFRQGAIDCILKPFNFEYIKLKVLSRVS